METQKKQFTFKGKTLEELKKLEVREFANLVPSRARRTILRQFQDIETFLNLVNIKISKNKPIKTHKRGIVIVPGLIGTKISVYNGRNFFPIEITGEMLGHIIGEFAPTRSRIKHSKAGVGATKGSKSKSKK